MKPISYIAQKLRELADKIKNSRKAAYITAGIGVLAMLLILLSGGNDSNEDISSETIPEPTFSGTEYADMVSRQLREILSAIDGVGDTEVMVTVSASERYEYASDVKSSSGGKESEYLIIKNGSRESAVVETVAYPGITGVVVVCEGAASDRVREAVYMAVTAALDIPSSKVYVAQMK